MQGHGVRFGSFEFDLDSGELRRRGRRVPLQGQPAQILAELVSRPGEVVTREDLRQKIWAGDTFVDFDAALNVAVNKIRQALSDSATAPRFVETLPRRGYRFLADVHPLPGGVSSFAPGASADRQGPGPPLLRASRNEQGPAPTVLSAAEDKPVTTPRGATARGRRSLRWVAAAGLTAVLTVMLAALWNGTRAHRSAPDIRSVAVLPFRPLVAETRDEALEVGLAEAVIIRLGQLPQLRVPSIHAVRHYAQQQPDPRLAGRDLGVETVLDGSLQRLNGNVRLSARLLDVATGTTMWAEQWDFPWTDIFTVQDAMAAEVTRALAVSLAANGERPSRPHPTSVAAYESYLRARFLLARRTLADSRRAAELLEDVVGLDPDSAAAHASLAFAYISIPLYEGPSRPFVEQARQAATRALDLDAGSGEARAVLARVLLHFDWDAEAADREMRRALQLSPTDPFVLHCYSSVLALEGRLDEALALGERALAQDPTSTLANRDMAYILYLSRRYDDCVEQCARTIELDPYTPFIHSLLGGAYEQLGRPAQAVEAFVTPLTHSERHGPLAMALREAARRDGLKGFWERRLQALLEEPVARPYAVASTYVRLGDHDRALDWLEKVYAERVPQIRMLKAHPEWDALRGDPRFQDLLRRARMAPADTPLLTRGPGSPLDARRAP